MFPPIIHKCLKCLFLFILGFVLIRSKRRWKYSSWKLISSKWDELVKVNNLHFLWIYKIYWLFIITGRVRQHWLFFCCAQVYRKFSLGRRSRIPILVHMLSCSHLLWIPRKTFNFEFNLNPLILFKLRQIALRGMQRSRILFRLTKTRGNMSGK